MFVGWLFILCNGINISLHYDNHEKRCSPWKNIMGLFLSEDASGAKEETILKTKQYANSY